MSPCPTPPRPSSSSATSSAASDGGRCSGCSPALRERHEPDVRRRQRRERRRRPRDHAEDRRRAARRRASTSSRSATTPTTARRSTRTSTTSERILRPANYLGTQPGHGFTVVERDGVRLGVVNLSGNLYLRAGRPAFPEIDTSSAASRARSTTSSSTCTPRRRARRSALGWYLDGRVTAVVGTHTHVPTADLRVLPGGTAYITDVGMTGPRGGVIGVKKDQAIESLRTHMSVRFETSADDPWLNGRRHPGVEAVARRLHRPGARAVDAEQRDHQRPEEPDDVEVEPVGDPELEADEHGGRQRGEPDEVAPPRARRRRRPRAARRATCTIVCAVVQPRRPQMQNGEPRWAWKPSVRSKNVRRSPSAPGRRRTTARRTIPIADGEAGGAAASCVM